MLRNILSHHYASRLFIPSLRNFCKEAAENRLHGDGPAVNISDTCVHRLREIIKSEKDKFLRVAVDGGGCSGFQYSFELDTHLNPDDKCFEKDGVKVVVDEVSLPFLDGATIDYHEELIRSSFRIVDNPKAAFGCSCGSSFALKSE